MYETRAYQRFFKVGDANVGATDVPWEYRQADATLSHQRRSAFS